MSNPTVRVAALQFGAGADVQENLEKCLAMIDKASEQQPDLMVLPEFVNHLSWYDDKMHCFNVSVALDGEFLTAVSHKAHQHNCHIVINVTLQQEDGTATGTSLLYGPDGRLLSTSDKQVLMGHENDFLERAQAATPITESLLGKLSTYACMDGVINETPRALALRGAQILGNSLNSFALDEASLHVPVRAAENKVFVVAANKVDPLIPEFLLEPVSQATSIPVHFLHGAGESQIVAPDGTVLAKAPRTGDAVIVADIDPSLADDKQRPDGTDIFASRRPELYAAIGQEPQPLDFPVGAAELQTAVYQPIANGPDAIEEAAEAIAQAAANGSQLIVLPELFCFADGVVDDVDTAVTTSQQAVQTLTAALQNQSAFVVTSIVEAVNNGGGHAHVGVVINSEGLIHRQPQLHRVNRHANWATSLGDDLQILEAPWGRFALIVGDDTIYPEAFRLASLQGADVVAAPMHVQERWEVELGLLERSAENRVCLIAASRPTPAGQSLICTLHNDFTLMTPWETRPFDGNISYPIVTHATDQPGLTTATIHPAHTQNKEVSKNTDVVNGRPWYLVEAITER
ncbi:nitrilase-related carbon-nitrogen hydrolase [Candidatus Leptofilum sp.]|uniref:nitrilase-related carbon-nitrogen hydrolase n=1 Tax=Candidatus Leptofilum sp. TaxID=3241576 RepID=UPI003B595E22